MSDERKVQEILAHYVRAADRRDGKSQGALFTDDAIVDVFVKTGPDAYQQIGEPIVGGAGWRTRSTTSWHRTPRAAPATTSRPTTSSRSTATGPT
ncbi:nuclear transport factor 2 family protein [Streptomyces sp. L7]